MLWAVIKTRAAVVLGSSLFASTRQNRGWATIALWALLAWTALFWRLGEPTFWDPDEAHYAVTTRELLSSGDWLAPSYNGEPFFDKPILFHDLQALSMSVAGANELGARLVPAVAALLLTAIVCWTGLALWGRDVGLVAGMTMTASPTLAALARYAILDSVFSALLFGGAAALGIAAVTNRPRLQLAGYPLVALAVLIKGPVAIVLIGLTGLIAVAVSPAARRSLHRLSWVRGSLVIVGLAAPWFLYMLYRFGSSFVQGYFLDENLSLFVGARFGTQPDWTFFLRVVAVGMLPWTPLLIGRLYDRWRSARLDGPAPLFETLLWCWVAAIVIFFSASHFKLDHYVFPAAPALYLLCVVAWAEVREAAPEDVRHRGARWGLQCIGPLLLIAGAVVAILLATRFALPSTAWLLPAGWIALGSVVTLKGTRALGAIPWTVASAFAGMYWVAVGVVIPAIEQQKVVHEVASWVSTHAIPSTHVCAYGLDRWNNSFLFYTARPVTLTNSLEVFHQVTTGERPYLCVVPKYVLDELHSAGERPEVVHTAVGLWATSGRALWRKRRPHTMFFVVAGPGAARAEARTNAQ